MIAAVAKGPNLRSSTGCLQLSMNCRIHAPIRSTVWREWACNNSSATLDVVAVKTHLMAFTLLAACVAISPGTNRTGTSQIVVFTGSKRPTAVDKKCCVSLFFQKEWRSYIFCIFVFYSLYGVKYILLGPTTGGYSHSLLCFMPGSYYFSDILGFILHTVISVNRQYACARRLSNARIRT